MEVSYEEAARLGGRMPTGLRQWEQYAYLCLRNLYWQYRDGAIDRDTVEVEKRKIMGAARRAENQAVFQDKLCASTTELWRRIEAAGTAYAQERTLEHADAFYEAVYRVGAGHGRLRGREKAIDGTIL